MNAKIDIKTPAGKSLEGFPQEMQLENMANYHTLQAVISYIDNRLGVSIANRMLNKGDIITIEIL